MKGKKKRPSEAEIAAVTDRLYGLIVMTVTHVGSHDPDEGLALAKEVRTRVKRLGSVAAGNDGAAAKSELEDLLVTIRDALDRVHRRQGITH